jgi:hypothetical protein
MTFNGYPVFKGLQKPLEFMGIRGRFPDLRCRCHRHQLLRVYRLLHPYGQARRFHLPWSIMAAIGLAAIYLKTEDRSA